jgi:glycerol uptake facilitator-like aquaporin
MAGAASGALQTLQRIGAAIGTATLATIFYHVLNQTDHDYQAAVSDALLGTFAFMLLTLLIALGEVTWRRHHLANGHRDQPGGRMLAT